MSLRPTRGFQQVQVYFINPSLLKTVVFQIFPFKQNVDITKYAKAVRMNMKSGINLLDETDILKVARSCTTVRVRAGEELIRKDDISDELYIVTDGSFKVYDDSYGEDFVHAILTKGAIFGEMSFLDGTPRSASVKAISNGSLLKMGKKEFDTLLVNNPDTALLFLFTLARVVTRRLREVNDALRGMTFSVGDQDSQKAIAEVIAQMEYAVHIELSGSQKSIG